MKNWPIKIIEIELLEFVATVETLIFKKGLCKHPLIYLYEKTKLPYEKLLDFAPLSGLRHLKSLLPKTLAPRPRLSGHCKSATNSLQGKTRVALVKQRWAR